MTLYKITQPIFSGLEKKYVLDCLKTTWVSSQGKYLELFEKNFAKFCGRKYATATSNGTVSLYLILLALGLKAGDEVIVPNFTYVAAYNAILYTGAKPILVDCLKDTFNLDPDLVEKSLTKKTKAIIAVHLYGNPCQMDKLAQIARKNRLHLIEDAAEAHGATFKNKIIGSFGVASSFSFFGNKTITTGEGGMITTDSAALLEKINLLKNQGQHPADPRYYHRCLGYNFRLTNLQAAIGLAQLKQIKKFVRQKQQINAWYRSQLSGLVKNGRLKFQKPTPLSRPGYWMNAILLTGKIPSWLAKKLMLANIETRPFFVPMNRLPYVKTSGRFNVSASLSQSGLILPGALNLKEKDVKFISQKIIKFLDQ